MKQSLPYIAAVLSGALLAAACTHELTPQEPAEGTFTGICITPVCDGIFTRAGETESGDSDYNENTISHWAWFIYSDAEGTNCLQSGWEIGNNPRTLVLDGILTSGATGYVYVIANLPGEYSYDFDDGIVYTDPETSAHTIYGKALAQLQTISFDSTFYNFTSATTGYPEPGSFVMSTPAPVAFTLTTGTTNVTADLKRAAAKIILDLKIAKDVKQTETTAAGAERYVKHWRADIDHLQIYMLWGSTHGDIAGTKWDYDGASTNTDWFYSASPRYAMYTNPKGGSYDASTNTVSGSVPQYEGEGTAPVGQYKETTLSVTSSVWEQVYEVNVDANGDPIWIWNTGTSDADKTDANIGNKTYGDWDYKLDTFGNKIPATDALGNFQYKLGTETQNIEAYSVSSLPLYSMPISWGVSGAHAPFIKIILPWRGHTRGSDGTETDEGSWIWDTKTTEFYYKILVPGRTTLDANGCYHISVDLSVLGSEADEVPVELYSTYHVVDWNTAETMGGVESAGRYLDCGDLFEFYSQNSMEIPVSSSHDITVTDVSVTYNNYSGSTVSVATLDASEYSITPVENTKVTIAHTMVTTLANMRNQDVARINYTFRIRHHDDASYYKEVKVIQYPPVYITADPNPGGDTYSSIPYGHVYVNGNTHGAGSNDWEKAFGIDSNTQNENTNMFILHVSVLEDPYLIGDPRVETGGDPSGGSVTWASAPGVEGSTSRTLQKFRKVEADDRTTNMIAPILRVASSYGAAYAYTFNQARYRCASYQEDGLPAGRWRLPTMAEIQYLVNLSAQGLIIRLFGSATGSTNYWCANGYATVDNENNTVTNTSGDYSSSSTTNYVRCVYDEWYWGETTNNDTVRGQYRSTFTWGDEIN